MVWFVGTPLEAIGATSEQLLAKCELGPTALTAALWAVSKPCVHAGRLGRTPQSAVGTDERPAQVEERRWCHCRRPVAHLGGSGLKEGLGSASRSEDARVAGLVPAI